MKKFEKYISVYLTAYTFLYGIIFVEIGFWEGDFRDKKNEKDEYIFSSFAIQQAPKITLSLFQNLVNGQLFLNDNNV